MKGRRKTTGRYATRGELIREVRYWYSRPGHSMADVARITKVSAGTVQKILDKQEIKPRG